MLSSCSRLHDQQTALPIVINILTTANVLSVVDVEVPLHDLTFLRKHLVHLAALSLDHLTERPETMYNFECGRQKEEERGAHATQCCFLV